jgi:hypothetical protein
MFDEIKQEVVEAGGVKTFKMERLRDLYGKDKLGKYVREGISNGLAQIGLSHSELPTYAWDEVRIYAQGSPVASLLKAATTVSEAGDEVLREAASREEGRILQQIRELVCR